MRKPGLQPYMYDSMEDYENAWAEYEYMHGEVDCMDEAKARMEEEFLDMFGREDDSSDDE